MSYKRDELKMDLYYLSDKDEETGDSRAVMTVVIKNDLSEDVQSSEIICMTTGKDKKKSYHIGAQSISSGSDPLLSAIENYWRGNNTERLAKALHELVLTCFSEGMNPAKTWMTHRGFTVFSDAELHEYLHEDILNTDGCTSSGKSK